MFKKFSTNDLNGYTLVKSSEFRRHRSALEDAFPDFVDDIREILPKKTPLYVAKAGDAALLCTQDGIPWFIHLIKDDVYLPTLRTLHKLPALLPTVQVDEGAIRFVLGGANIMCPGLTSKGGNVGELEAGDVCAVMAEGKQLALAIGKMEKDAATIRSENAGIAIETLHFLGDGLWKSPVIKD